MEYGKNILEKDIRNISESNRREKQQESIVLRLHSFGMTDRGLVCTKNEDQFLIADLSRILLVRQSSLPDLHTQYSERPGTLFLVADGLGAGLAEEATSREVKLVQAFLLNELEWPIYFQNEASSYFLEALRKALKKADQNMFHDTMGNPECAGRGTMLTMAFFLDPVLYMAHIGDSRAYLFRDNKLTQITHDLTITEDRFDGCNQPKEENRVGFHPTNSKITEGSDEDQGFHVETDWFSLVPRDRILFCTDGLTKMVSGQQIASILQEVEDPRHACMQLVTQANEAGGWDNITVIVAQTEEYKINEGL
jgi:protein phosphatase